MGLEDEIVHHLDAVEKRQKQIVIDYEEEMENLKKELQKKQEQIKDVQQIYGTEKTNLEEGRGRLEETRNIIRDNIQKLQCSNPPNPQPNPQRVPDGFLCPITGEIMKDPVIDNQGISYEREAIEEWLRRGNTTSPFQQPLQLCDLRPNVDLRKSIEDWQKNRNL